MLFATIKATSQKIDTCITRCNAAKINSVYVTSGYPIITDTATHLGVFDYTDDLKGKCVANYVLLNKSKNIVVASYSLSEEEYNEWDGTAIGLLAVIGRYLKLTFKP